MTLGNDLGVLGNLGTALGIFDAAGNPNEGWFAHPEDSLKSMLANAGQREALIAFVDEAMGGADRTTDGGVTWLPIVDLDDPPLSVAVTIDEAESDGLHIGLGLRVRTTDPDSATTLAVPLFRVQKEGGPSVSQPLLLGSPGGRIRIGTTITVDHTPPLPGHPRLGAIGLEVDVPTSDSDGHGPVFGLSLTGLQLPGAAEPRDVRVVADGAEHLDDALLDLVLSLVRTQADAAAAGSPIAAVSGLLGLRSDDRVPDFPITSLPDRGVVALADWVRGILVDDASRGDWLGHLGSLVEGTLVGDVVQFDLGGSAVLGVRLRVDSGPSGNTVLTVGLEVGLGGAEARVEVEAEVFRIDLVTGEAFALPKLGLWAAAGDATHRILDLAGPPVARAETLRLGFELDGARRLNFVLAADGVTLGAHDYPTLDLTSPDAVMDAVGNTVADVANELLGGLGDALQVARTLIGLDAPPGITAVTLPAMMTDPVAAVSGYWQELAGSSDAMRSVLGALAGALADASQAAATVTGTGSAGDPWRVPLIGPVRLELASDGSGLSVGVAAATSVDTLGQRCTVVETRIAATLARIDLEGRTASLMNGVEGTLTARERGVSPRRARLVLGEGVALTADHVGLRLGWSPDAGLGVSISAPSLALSTGSSSLPVTLPSIAPDGTITMPVEAWSGVEALVGYFGHLIGGFVGDVVRVLGWLDEGGMEAPRVPRLRLAELVISPDVALREWLIALALSDLAPFALGLLADAFGGSGPVRGFVGGRGGADDPYRLDLAAGLPGFALWFPTGKTPDRLEGAPPALTTRQPGAPGLGAVALAAALVAEGRIARDVRELVEGRDVAGGLDALSARWVGGDGRIVAPPAAPAGVTIRRIGLAAPQLLASLEIEDLIGRDPVTTVFVALGAEAWLDVPAGRRVDLSAAGLASSMFSVPDAATGDWFVALGRRDDCRPSDSGTDGTPEQAERLARLLDALAVVSTDIAVVAVAGAGHAARVAAEAQAAVTDLVTLGTPLSPISLTAIASQPTGDALRLLHRLLPQSDVAEDEDLALGRALVGSMMELVPLADPGADLRPSVVPPGPPRSGLNVVALYGDVSTEQVGRAVTAVVAAGLAERARARTVSPPEPATAAHAGLEWTLDADPSSALAVTGSARLRLLTCEVDSGAEAARELRVRLRIADRDGWLASTPELELRAVSFDLTLPLSGGLPGQVRLVLHDGRVFGQSWEALALGNVSGALPVLPEARVLLSTAVQRVAADVGSATTAALSDLLEHLGLVDSSGGVVGDAFDQLAHDPGGFVQQRLAAVGADFGTAVGALLGAAGTSVDLASRTVRLTGGGDDQGRFGWALDLTASPGDVTGVVRLGPEVGHPTEGGLELRLGLGPLQAGLVWHQGGGRDESVALWPAPNGDALAGLLARAAPSLGAHVALELMRRADESARPIIDAVLDALGLLRGAPGEAERAIRPLAGLLGDPAGWLRSAGSLASSPLKIQALFDALRPLMGLAGSPGDALALAGGVDLSVVAEGGGARLALSVDPTGWTAPADASSRLGGAIAATVSVFPSGPPGVGLEVSVGLPGAAAGRQAVHARIGTSGAELFLRPATGADIPLVPFAGLGALSAVAEAALPFLLDRLAEIPGTPGDLVRTVGDAFALRSGAPAKFSADALRAWATNPVGALTAAVPSIVTTGLATIAPLLDAFLPASVSAIATSSELSVTVAGVSLSWDPSEGRVSLEAPSVVVPGVETVGFRLAISDVGLDELSVAVGPARVDAGGVLLRPFASVSAGLAPAGGRRVAVGLSADDTHHFAARWSLDSGAFDLVASDGALAEAVDSTDPEQVALRVVEVMLDLAATVAMAQSAVQDLLDTSVGDEDVRFLLQGVVLADTPHPTELIGELFVPEAWLGRVHRLISNIAGAGISIEVDGLRLTFTSIEHTIGLEVGVVDRFELLSGDVTLWLENDVKWITPRDDDHGGLFVGFLPTALPLRFTPTLVVNGLGLRLGKSSGPLLDSGLTIESVAFHVYAAISGAGATSGGIQLQFSNLAVATSGASGDNAIAQGIVRDSGPTPPKPAFSPALAIQKHGSGPVAVSLRAGDPPGPWWIAIRKGFGPLYLEQIGFNATMPQGRLESISVLMDGSVSMFGLTCAVDDLSITYFTSNGDFFSPESWAVDLAGLAISADMAGVTLAGGLLKQTTPQGTEYLGMLLGRFAVYGLTVYGGYGEGEQDGQKFTAFFAIGAVNGPIGGPPAFFLTGIGGGFGINRKLVVPTDLANFGDYPLIQALDIAATPGDPMTQLRELGQYYPMQKGTFWFAAGLSFNSFALVDGIAVLGVQIGDGLDINLLGLARMALPRPEAPLVSIELALLVRFSSSEGVLWVQGQLTDNSWLLYPDIRITGGFAYVIWFKGDKAGEFVLTLGGYHPSFHRDGYPVVPRLGLHWSVSDNIVIEAGSYFALTSEALMAGGSFEASATFGPAWAEVKFGADGIVYFDPFSYDVSAYARIAAGVTIDAWIFGEVTISINLGARIHVLGPEFRGSATFEVGPIELTVSFGGSDKALKEPLGEAEFIAKYLEAAESGKARAHAVMTNSGALPSKGDKSTPDGSATRPFVVTAEFSLIFTTTVPATRVTQVSTPSVSTDHAPSVALGVAPRNVANIDPEITLTWRRDNVARAFPFAVGVRPYGRFPAGIWGPPQDPDHRKVPKGEMIEALSELDLACGATASPAGPEIAYYQVEIGQRRPLPFSRRSTDVSRVRHVARQVSELVEQPETADAAFTKAAEFLAATASPTALAALRGERQAPPRMGVLTEGLETKAETVVPVVIERPPQKVYDHFVDAPIAVALLSGAAVDLRVGIKSRTTVQGAERAWRRTPPTLASVKAERSRSIAARLTLTDTPAVSRRSTLLAAREVPLTAQAHGATAIVSRRGAASAATLATFGAALTAGAVPAQAGRRAAARGARATTGGAALAAGQVVVLKLPNARADVAVGKRPTLAVSGAPARVVLLAHGGQRLADATVGPGARARAIEVPRGTERIVAMGLDAAVRQRRAAGASAGLSGWHAGMQLPYAGWATALGPGCTVHAVGDRLALHRERLDAGWVSGAELTRGTSTVSTTFATAPRTVVIVLDDPAATGEPVSGRRLLLGLDGAARAVGPDGSERPPVLLEMGNRSALAYDVVPEGDRPVVVTIATQPGWALVGVMGSDEVDAKGAVALIAARGLMAALLPFASVPGSAAQTTSRIRWIGPVRSAEQRLQAKAMAQGGARLAAPKPEMPAAPKRASRSRKTKGRR